MTAVGVIVAIVGLGFLILAHEFGHFIVAKLSGMRVEEFSVGFGRFLVSKRFGETVYGISWLPLGGYVRVTGMHKEEFQARIDEAREREAEAQFRQERAPKKRRPRDPEERLAGPRALTADDIASTPVGRRYYAHPFWHKVLFIVAGVTMNVFVAFLLFVAYGAYTGDSYPITTMQAVVTDSPAGKAGMLPGDKIIGVDNRQVTDWQQVQDYIRAHPDQTVRLEVDRNGQILTLTPTLGTQQDPQTGQTIGYLGVQAKLDRKGLGFGESFKFGGTHTGGAFKAIFVGFKMMFSGQAPVTGDQGLAGPIGIIQLSSEAYQGGQYLYLLAFISINLAVINILPVLPLDGGWVLFSIIEKIRGRSISLRVFEQVSMVGLVLFGALFILATTNDIGRLFG